METIEFMKQFEPLWGGWQVDRFLGSGSQSTVFLISKQEWGYTYQSALKVIRMPYKDAENTMKSELLAEIQLLYSLRGNSHIVIFEDSQIINYEKGQCFLLFLRVEYLKSLTDHLKDLVQWDLNDFLTMAIDISSAMAYCHQNQVIHRDIKPDNIFLKANTYKLGDFGVSKKLEDQFLTYTSVGTPIYAAPEVILNQPYDTRSDIYSFGLVLYQLLNDNRLPFVDDTSMQNASAGIRESIARRLKGEVFSLPENCRGHLRILGETVMKACAFKIEERFISADAFKEALLHIKKNINLSQYRLDLKKVFNRGYSAGADKENHKESALGQTEYMGNIKESALGQTEYMGNIKESALNQTEYMGNIKESALNQTEYMGNIKESALNQTEYMGKSIRRETTEKKHEDGSQINELQSGNLVNGGLVLAIENGVLLSEINQNFALIYEDENRGIRRMEIKDYCFHLTKLNDHVFFVSGNNLDKIVRLNINTHMKEIFCPLPATQLRAYGENMYFLRPDKGNRLYVQSIREKEARLFLDTGFKEFFIAEEKVYGVNMKGDIVCVDIQHKAVLFRLDDNAAFVQLEKEYLYFVRKHQGSALFRMDVKNLNVEKILSQGCASVNVHNGKIYYANREDACCLYVFDEKSKKNQKIWNAPCEYIHVVGGRIFFIEIQETQKWRVLNLESMYD